MQVKFSPLHLRGCRELPDPCTCLAACLPPVRTPVHTLRPGLTGTLQGPFLGGRAWS